MEVPYALLQRCLILLTGYEMSLDGPAPPDLLDTIAELEAGLHPEADFVGEPLPALLDSYLYRPVGTGDHVHLAYLHWVNVDSHLDELIGPMPMHMVDSFVQLMTRSYKFAEFDPAKDLHLFTVKDAAPLNNGLCIVAIQTATTLPRAMRVYGTLTEARKAEGVTAKDPGTVKFHRGDTSRVGYYRWPEGAYIG